MEYIRLNLLFIEGQQVLGSLKVSTHITLCTNLILLLQTSVDFLLQRHDN